MFCLSSSGCFCCCCCCCYQLHSNAYPKPFQNLQFLGFLTVASLHWTLQTRLDFAHISLLWRLGFTALLHPLARSSIRLLGALVAASADMVKKFSGGDRLRQVVSKGLFQVFGRRFDLLIFLCNQVF